jgi:hypothetical protein
MILISLLRVVQESGLCKACQRSVGEASSATVGVSVKENVSLLPLDIPYKVESKCHTKVKRRNAGRIRRKETCFQLKVDKGWGVHIAKFHCEVLLSKKI